MSQRHQAEIEEKIIGTQKLLNNDKSSDQKERRGKSEVTKWKESSSSFPSYFSSFSFSSSSLSSSSPPPPNISSLPPFWLQNLTSFLEKLGRKSWVVKLGKSGKFVASWLRVHWGLTNRTRILKQKVLLLFQCSLRANIISVKSKSQYYFSVI